MGGTCGKHDGDEKCIHNFNQETFGEETTYMV